MRQVMTLYHDRCFLMMAVINSAEIIADSWSFETIINDVRPYDALDLAIVISRCQYLVFNAANHYAPGDASDGQL